MTQFFDAVVFDCDGVLVDSEVLSMQVSQRVVADLGWDTDLETLMTMFMGCSTEFYVAEVEKRIGRKLEEGWALPYRLWFEEAFSRDLREIDGISAAISEIALPTAVASNSRRDRIRLSLGIVGLLDHFEGRICSAEDETAGKPAPDVYLTAASVLGVDPRRCIAVEDSSFGVQAARAAGMRVLAYATDMTPPGAHDGERTTVFRSMSALPALIDELRRNGSLTVDAD